MNTDWDALNNILSDAVLEGGLLADLLKELGCDRLTRSGGGPSLLGLVRGVLSSRQGQAVHPQFAANFLTNFLGGTGRLDLTREQVRGRLRIPSPYFLSWGYSPAVLDRLDAGHSPMLGRSVVPLYDDAGHKCVGFIARSEHPACGSCKKHHRPGQPCRYGQQKWRIHRGFPKSSYLYNYAATRRPDCRVVLLVEGTGDVFRAEEAGIAAVACLGTHLSDVQAAKLAALGKPVLIAFDNDDAGRQGAAAAAERLRGLCEGVRACPVPAGFHDVGDMPAEAVARWVQRRAELLAVRDGRVRTAGVTALTCRPTPPAPGGSS
jgi:hypothetical protein